MTTKRKPSHSCPRYVCARVRKLFAAQGWPLHKMTGQYSAYFNKQVGTAGFSVTKIGCSRSVNVSFCDAYVDGRTITTMSRDQRKDWQDKARALLIASGYTLDADYAGIAIVCDGYDDHDR